MNAQTLNDRVEKASELLKSVGLRRTIARINLLQCLAAQETPATQSEISDKLSVQGFDASTIFRGLTDLTEAGLAIRIDVGDRIWRFELRDRDANGQPSERHHPHAVCLRCGRVACLPSSLAGQFDEISPDWLVSDLIVRGICDHCQSAGCTFSRPMS